MDVQNQMLLLYLLCELIYYALCIRTWMDLAVKKKVTFYCLDWDWRCLGGGKGSPSHSLPGLPHGTSVGCGLCLLGWEGNLSGLSVVLEVREPVLGYNNQVPNTFRHISLSLFFSDTRLQQFSLDPQNAMVCNGMTKSSSS